MPPSSAYRLLSGWALLASASYVTLVALFVTVVRPAGEGLLPADYLELVAASRQPVLYRLTITLDIASWLLLGGFLVAMAACYLRRAMLRGALIAALGASAAIGFLGACLRLAGTADLAERYLAAPAPAREAVLMSYLDQQRLVNVSFSAGGLLMGLGFLLTATIAWRVAELSRPVSVLLATGGALGMTKGVLELATGADLGPVALLQAVAIVGGLVTLAVRFGRRAGTPGPA